MHVTSVIVTEPYGMAFLATFLGNMSGRSVTLREEARILWKGENRLSCFVAVNTRSPAAWGITLGFNL